jgi:hypothetical protein
MLPGQGLNPPQEFRTCLHQPASADDQANVEGVDQATQADRQVSHHLRHDLTRNRITLGGGAKHHLRCDRLFPRHVPQHGLVTHGHSDLADPG